MKKAYLLLSSIVLSCNVSLAQVNVTEVGGPPPINYPNLTAAFFAINSGTHTGEILVDITASIVEPSGAMASLNPSGVFGSSYTSVTIQPAGPSITVEGDGIAVINLRGADNVTIDGNWLGGGGTHDLTIRNTSTGGGNAAIWVSSTALGGINGATANLITNCIFEGVDSDETSYGIISCGTAIGLAPLSPNNNNRYNNNIVRQCRIGIAVVGGASADVGLQINGNRVGSVAAGQGLGTRGISVVNVDGTQITNNTVLGVSADVAQAVTGIDLSQAIYNTVVAGNRVHNISNLDATGFGAVGIYVNSITGGSSNIQIYNNEIHSISSQGHPAAPFAEDNGNYGIAILQSDGYDLYHNTIYMSEAPVSGDGGSAALYIGAAVTDEVNLMNNVLINNTTGGVNYSVYSGVATTLGNTNSAVNYNLYYSTGDLGYLGAVTATFADWKTILSTKDKGSVSGAVQMLIAGDGVAADNTDANCWLINGRAMAMASYGLDINGNTRSVTPGFPNDMGSREFTPATGVLPPVATADAAPSPGGITTYSVGQRKVARIEWGTGGTVPVTVDVQYYSGIDPATIGYPTSNRIHSYYDIQETGGAGYSFQVEFYFTDAENRGIPDGILQTVKDTTGTGEWGNKDGSVTSDADGKYVEFGSVLFNGGLFTLGNIPLGLELLTFTAKNNNNVNDLAWATAAEKNMTHFDVERSANGVDFVSIGSVKCNNDAIANSYKFRDVEPKAGYNYYRLKMNERDGRGTYSDIAAVKNGAVTNVDITSLYPNPANDKISVTLNSLVAGEISVQVTDITGKVILSQRGALQQGANEVSFNVSGLPSGMYMIKASLPDGTVSVQKFVKQ